MRYFWRVLKRFQSDLVQGLLKSLKISHPLSGKAVVHNVRLVQGHNEWELGLVENALWGEE